MQLKPEITNAVNWIFNVQLKLYLKSILIRIRPIAVQNSSLNLQIIETKSPAETPYAKCEAAITKPPSLPPNCMGRKNRILANSDVNDIINYCCPVKLKIA